MIFIFRSQTIISIKCFMFMGRPWFLRFKSDHQNIRIIFLDSWGA